MNEQIQNPGQTTTVWGKMGLILNWFFGVIFALLTFFELLEFSYTTPIFFICTYLTLPPLYNSLKTKYQFSLPTWGKVMVIAVFMMLSNYIWIIEP